MREIPAKNGSLYETHLLSHRLAHVPKDVKENFATTLHFKPMGFSLRGEKKYDFRKISKKDESPGVTQWRPMRKPRLW
ncbi:MAG TPA: hypothetical protein DCL41_02380 [Bdellovibrionales bacterium]|nr:hypothetical protein [Pseudobdellovibrionaceae bacterium]HAG90687.1 hypothetical protein [Bdellovibrionales bacterium]